MNMVTLGLIYCKANKKICNKKRNNKMMNGNQ